MDSINQLKTNALSAGKRNVSSVAQGGVHKQAKTQETAVATTSVPAKPVKENGVSKETTAEGFLSQTADSGMSVLTTDNGQVITLPTGESFQLNAEGLTSLNEGETKTPATLTKSTEGVELISFQDKDQNTVQVDPESLVFEVLNKQKNLSQVYLPDGHQEVVAFGQFRSAEGKYTPYEHHAVYNPSGQMVDVSGFSGLAVNGKKLSFELENGVRSERTLARPLPGQKPFEESQVTPVVDSAASNPLTLMGDEPLLAAGNTLNTTVPAVDVPQASPEVSQNQPPASGLAGLTDISKDFFAGSDNEGVTFDQTVSKLVMRQEGNSRAFLLPNGDSFRTDGKDLEVLGQTPRAKNARIVNEGEAQLLAYSDGDGNHHSLDINTGDYEVSNRQGTLTQGLKADGTTEYGVRGTYTSDAGKPQQYFLKAKFGESGTLLSKEGFDDLRIAGDKMSFTLPNGQETDRTLVQASEHNVNIPKKLVLTGGVADEWGSALALADSFLNTAGTEAASKSIGMGATANANANAAINSGPAAQPAGAPRGVVRQELPDGGSLSTLPNGIQIIDGNEIKAVDSAGNPLAVQKSQLESEIGTDSHLLSVTTPDGIGYTISNQNLDMIVQSPDGKIHQLVGPTGKILTSIMDNGNQHLHELDPMKGSSGSPGTRIDRRFPDRLFIDGSPVGSYQLPHPFGPKPQPSQETPQPLGQTPGPNGPSTDNLAGWERERMGLGGNGATEGDMPNGQDSSWSGGNQGISNGYTAGPGGVQQGFQPSFWQRFKGAFTGENPWNPASQYGNGFDPRMGGDPRMMGGDPRMMGGDPRMMGGDPRMMGGFDPRQSGFPGSTYPPIDLQRMEMQNQRMERQTQMMTMGLMGMNMMTSMSRMSMMFFSPFGMF